MWLRIDKRGNGGHEKRQIETKFERANIDIFLKQITPLQRLKYEI